MTLTPQPEPLEPHLRQVEAELVHHLHEACALEPEDVATESTGEMLRLEDALQQAARAAEKAVALRRRMKQAPGAATESVREFTDERGLEWRVWAVMPGRARPKEESLRYLGEFAEGWLAFEALDGTKRRRLPAYPADWMTRSEEGLRELMRRAQEATPHRREGPLPGEREAEASGEERDADAR